MKFISLILLSFILNVYSYVALYENSTCNSYPLKIDNLICNTKEGGVADLIFNSFNYIAEKDFGNLFYYSDKNCKTRIFRELNISYEGCYELTYEMIYQFNSNAIFTNVIANSD